MILIALAIGIASSAMAAPAQVPAPGATPGVVSNADSTTPPKKKKIIQKKSASRKGVTTRREAREDHLTLPQATSPATTTTSMPNLNGGNSAADAAKVTKKKTFRDNVRAGILFEYYGSSIADPLNGEQPDHTTGYGIGSFPAELDTHLTLGYALTSNLTFTLNGYFWSYADIAPGANDGQRFGFRPADSYFKLAAGKFIQAGRFKWSGDFRFYPGLGTDYPRRLFYLRTGQNLSYSLTPRLTLAAYNSLRYYQSAATAYAIDRDPTGNRIDSRATFGPAIEYQLFDAAGVSLSFNTEFAHTHNNNTISQTSNFFKEPVAGFYRSYFELGSSIDVTKFINFNPYIDMYTQSFNVDAMQFGANLNITIL